MVTTYKAKLKNDRLEWIGSSPSPNDRELLVNVSIATTEEPVAPGKSSVRAVAALRAIAARGGLKEIIPDPVAWQREIRKDRVLPGREE